MPTINRSGDEERRTLSRAHTIMEREVERRRRARLDREAREREQQDILAGADQMFDPNEATPFDDAIVQRTLEPLQSIEDLEQARTLRDSDVDFINMYSQANPTQYEIEFMRRALSAGWGPEERRQVRREDAKKYRRLLVVSGQIPTHLITSSGQMNDLEFFAIFNAPVEYERFLSNRVRENNWDQGLRTFVMNDDTIRFQEIVRRRAELGLTNNDDFLRPDEMNDDMYIVWFDTVNSAQYRQGIQAVARRTGETTTQVNHRFAERARVITDATGRPHRVSNVVITAGSDEWSLPISAGPTTVRSRTVQTSQRERPSSRSTGSADMRGKALRHDLLAFNTVYCKLLSCERHSTYVVSYENLRCECQSGRTLQKCSHVFRAILERAKDSCGANTIILFDSAAEMYAVDIGEAYEERGYYWREVQGQGGDAICTYAEYTETDEGDAVQSREGGGVFTFTAGTPHSRTV